METVQPFKVCEVKDCPGYGTPHPPLPPAPGQWSDREVLERLTAAASQLCDDAERAGHRWGSYYETRALIHGIRTLVLNHDN